MIYKSTCFIILVAASLQLRAQDYFRQLTFGASVEATRAFAGNTAQKNDIAFSGNIGYYPTPYINFTLEGQGGKLAGSPAAATLYLSLIHISEPTRQAEISYAVFCLQTKTK